MWEVLFSYILGTPLSIWWLSEYMREASDMTWIDFSVALVCCLVVGLLWPAWVIIYVIRESP